MDFVVIDKNNSFDKEIPVSKVFITDADGAEDVLEIRWQGNLKPGAANVEATVTDKKRYEEIQLLQVNLSSRDRIYSIASTIYKAIKYPCIVEYKHNEATSIGTGRFDRDIATGKANVNVKPFFSHWIRQDYMSEKAANMIKMINEALNQPGEIGRIMDQVRFAIPGYHLGGTAKTNVKRLIKEVVFNQPSEIRKKVEQICIPYKYYPSYSKSEKYQKKSGGWYKLICDYEEIWYCFMTCDDTRAILEDMHITDVESWVKRVENKYWEQSKEW